MLSRSPFGVRALRGMATAAQSAAAPAAPRPKSKKGKGKAAPEPVAPKWTSPSAEANAPRIYTQRKAFLYDYYTHILRRSQLVLLFKHENLTVPNMTAIRHAIEAIPVPKPASLPQETVLEKAALTVTRTGILKPVVRAERPFAAQFEAGLDGQTAMITCPTLSPKYVKSMLAAIERIIKKSQKDEDPKKVVKQPALTLLGGILEGKTLLQPNEVLEAAKLPELDQLRGQLIGLLESPQRSLVGVVSQAGGGSLVRTLQGLEESLKEKEAAPPS